MNRFELIGLVKLLSNAIIKEATRRVHREPFFNLPFGIKGSLLMHSISTLAYSVKAESYGMKNWAAALGPSYKEAEVQQWWQNATTVAVIEISTEIDENNGYAIEELEEATNFIAGQCKVEYPECYYYFAKNRKNVVINANFPKTREEAEAWTKANIATSSYNSSDSSNSSEDNYEEDESI